MSENEKKRLDLSALNFKEEPVPSSVALAGEEPYVPDTNVGDMISRKDAIDALKEKVFHNLSDEFYGAMQVFDIVTTALLELPSAQPEQRWIPVSERLPEVRQWVLCQCRATIMDVLRLTKEGCWQRLSPRTEYFATFVTAWMPLPEPYKGGENNESD